MRRRWLTAEEHSRIKALREQGLTVTQIAERFGIPLPTIEMIVTGRSKPHVYSKLKPSDTRSRCR